MGYATRDTDHCPELSNLTTMLPILLQKSRPPSGTQRTDAASSLVVCRPGRRLESTPSARVSGKYPDKHPYPGKEGDFVWRLDLLDVGTPAPERSGPTRRLIHHAGIERHQKQWLGSAEPNNRLIGAAPSTSTAATVCAVRMSVTVCKNAAVSRTAR